MRLVGQLARKFRKLPSEIMTLFYGEFSFNCQVLEIMNVDDTKVLSKIKNKNADRTSILLYDVASKL